MLADINPIGSPFLELQSIDSTNNYAMALIHEGVALHGTAIFASEQIKGKGQRDRHWYSKKGENIILSVIIHPQKFLAPDFFVFSMAMALSVCNFFNKLTNDAIKIKWPNDIYWRDRKAGGILIENVLQGQVWKFAIVGIGLNINQTEFGELQKKAVSLKQITGKHYAPLQLAKELCVELNDQYNAWLTSSKKIISEYKQKLYKVNEKVQLKKDSRVFDAIIKDVTTSGQLVVQHGTEETFDVGEVEWVIREQA